MHSYREIEITNEEKFRGHGAKASMYALVCRKKGG
jgi:hypothetical protein